MSEIIKPSVEAAYEFLEIMNDFTDPREIIREGISNSYDAQAKRIEIEVSKIQEIGKPEIKITIRDNGEGMIGIPQSDIDKKIPNIKTFFALGDSTRRTYDLETKEKKTTGIGTKGHGTKIFYKSRLIRVETYRDNKKTIATVKDAMARFYHGEMPDIETQSTANSPSDWWKTSIEIIGYDAQESFFEHEALKDYIYWFTKHGSPELQFNVSVNKGKKIFLKGLGKEAPAEELEFGHVFPEECYDIKALKTKYPQHDFTKYFVKRWCFLQIPLSKHPGVNIDFIFSIEGDEAKRLYNKMLKEGKYTVVERYGIWLCKDYIPIQKVNEWIAKKTEWTKFHSFINCQHLELTANRGSVNNTKKEFIEDIEDTVKTIFKNKIATDHIYQKYLEAIEEEEAQRTIEQEKADYTKRAKKARKKKHAKYKSIDLFEPQNEAETITLFVSVSSLMPKLFEFIPVDYNTKAGYDTLIRAKDRLAMDHTELKFVEFKHRLKSPFNHSFENLNHIVCWDCDLADETDFFDIGNKKATLHITKTKEGTKNKLIYTLKTESEKIIKVYVLREYLKEQINLKFQ
jgi:hypothetical protein